MPRYETPVVTVSRPDSMPPDGSGRGHTVVWVRGEHDVATQASLVVAIAGAAQHDDADLVVDLSGVTFMDASIVGALVGSRNRLRLRSRSLEVRAPSRASLRVLEICGLAHLVRPATAVAHPVGEAAALSTWVDVSTQADPDSDPSAHGAAPADELRFARSRPSIAGAVVEMERGGS